jgi:hypothetical protein
MSWIVPKFPPGILLQTCNGQKLGKMCLWKETRLTIGDTKEIMDGKMDTTIPQAVPFTVQSTSGCTWEKNSAKSPLEILSKIAWTASLVGILKNVLESTDRDFGG